MTMSAYRFDIRLEGIEPPIWRRIRVPGDYTFWDLHVAIQDAMGWLDCHLHQFLVRNPETGAPEQIGIPDDESFLDEEPCLAGWEVPIAGYFIDANDTATYEYDFGDDWRHAVKFEGTDELRQGERALACLAGERLCPPSLPEKSLIAFAERSQRLDGGDGGTLHGVRGPRPWRRREKVDVVDLAAIERAKRVCRDHHGMVGRSCRV